MKPKWKTTQGPDLLDIELDNNRVPPDSLFMVKGWNRSVSCLAVLMAAYEYPVLYEAASFPHCKCFSNKEFYWWFTWTTHPVTTALPQEMPSDVKQCLVGSGWLNRLAHWTNEPSMPSSIILFLISLCRGVSQQFLRRSWPRMRMQWFQQTEVPLQLLTGWLSVVPCQHHWLPSWLYGLI